MQLKWVSNSNPSFSKKYTVKRLPITTRHFKKIEEVYIGKKRLVTLASQPASNILDPFAIIAKFDNWVCYDENMHVYILGFIQDNQFEFLGFSRVDFCADFNFFDNGMIPDKFIKKYIYRKCMRLGRTPHVAHHFEQGKTEHIEKGLKFGSNLSEVTAYIYDKSRQMETEMWKPYIYMAWKKAGLNVDCHSPWDESNKAPHVFRLEFSVKSGAKLLADTETGELNLLLDLQLMADEYIYKIFYKLYERFFTFVWNDGQVRRDRMRKIKLFNYTFSNSVMVNAEKTENASRSKKIFVKKLDQLNKEMRGTDILMNSYIDQFKNKLIEDSHIQSWAMKQGINTKFNE